MRLPGELGPSCQLINVYRMNMKRSRKHAKINKIMPLPDQQGLSTKQSL